MSKHATISPEEAADRLAIRELVEASGFDPRFYFVKDSASDTPYYGYYAPDVSAAKANIYVESAGPSREVREISEVSHVVRGLLVYRIPRLCFPGELADSVRTLSKGYE